MFSLQFSLLFIGIGMNVAPGLASLITQIQVIFSILLGVIFFKEVAHIWQIIGSIISFAGLLVVAKHVEGSVSLEGFLFLIGAALFWSIGNLLSKKIGKIDTFSLVIWSSFFAWPPLLLFSLIFEGPEAIYLGLLQINGLTILATLYITYCSTLLGYGLWSYLINHIPLGTITSFTILIPVIALLSSVTLLKEPMQTWKIFATLLVLSGLAINLFGKKLKSFFKKLRA
jgi:O-acetylserine/cysteine efflux transporter